MNRRRQDVATVRISDEEYSRLESKFEALKNEFTACRRKLDSKCEALLILSKELDQCRSERDQFKLMAEQLRERCQTLKTSLSGKPKQSTSDTGIYKNYTDTQSQNLARLLYESKEYSKSLQFEVDDLKQKLHDANGDIKLLREQIARSRVGTTDEGLSTRHFPAHEREELVQKLESSNEQYLQLERDLQTVLDEKEELVTERDVYKTKYERLNQELNYILKGHEDRVVDIDALIMDNRYLKDRLKQMEDEKRMTMAAVSKYKRILEKKKSKSSMKFGQNRGGGMVITEKQIQEVLQSQQSVLGTPQAISDWQALAASLLESVNDKKLALYHQRKTNKILGNRVAELEKKIKTLECAGLWSIPGNISSSLEKLKNDCVDIEMLTPRKQSDTDSERLSPSEGERESELETVTPLDSIENSPLTSPQHIAKTTSSHLELTNLDTDLDLLPTKEVPTKPQHSEQSDTFQYPATKMFGMSPSDKFSHGTDHEIDKIKDILLANEAKAISQGIDSQYDKIRADVEHQHVGDTNVEDKCLVDLSDQELTVSAQRSDYSEVNGVLQNTEDVITAVDISGDISDKPQCVHVYNQDKLDDTVDADDVNKADDVDDKDQELRNSSATDRGSADSDGDIDEVDNEELDGFLNDDDSEASEKVGLLIESVTKKMCNISHQDSKDRETDTCSNDREKDRETRGLDSRGRGKGRKVRREKERSRSGDSDTDIHPLLNSPGNTIDESINSVDEPHDVQC
ncbi:coiled-coil domain-containing protein 149-B-like [Ruditapes philippinarum]|uniref:coiled-coil domain-containing protein 149-B-like n=1 Tax=Ruditapes philippinarum TaxID=129788 RepID=UPI00295BDB78|nr:coiled-coil domain-containing protein 149-B-like [Ruditapes philippinarum]